jgi:DNA-binding response OmpR family regulator
MAPSDIKSGFDRSWVTKMTVKTRRHPRVLLVEDDDAVGRVLRLYLRNNDFDTETAVSGGEALHMLQEAPFEAVVLDLCLPDGLGGAVLRQLRNPSGGGHPVCVTMSALDEDEATRRFGPLQAPFLAKPFDPCRLVDTLTELLSRESPTAPCVNASPPGGRETDENGG